MEYLVLALWGLVSGAIAFGSFGHKAETDITPEVPAAVQNVSEIELVKTVVAEAEQVTEIIVPEVVNSVSEEPAEVETVTPVPTPKNVYLPNGMKPEQLLYDEQDQPKTHVLKRGESLTQLSQIYYADARFWPYIFEVNRHLLTKPDNVQAEMVLYLPDPEYYQIDANDIGSINRARALIAKYTK